MGTHVSRTTGRVAEVRVTPVAFRDPPLLNSTGVHEPFALRAVLEVVDEAGRVGLGETYGDTTMLGHLRTIAETLPGLDVFDLNELARAVATSIRASADEGNPLAPGTHGDKDLAKTYGAFEVALLDLQGRILGRPVSDLLGGAIRSEVPFSAYLFYKFERHRDDPGYPPDPWGEVVTPEQLVEQAVRMVEQYGFESIKLKGGAFEPELEIESVRQLHEAFPDHPLRIDPNAAWTPATSLHVARSLEGLLEYLEDPTPGMEGMADVARQVDVPLATNMVVTSLAHLPEAVRLGAVQVILADHHYWGGLRATQTLGAICATWGLGLSMHSNSHLGISLAAMSHVAATIPNLTYACDTHYPWQEEDVLEGGRLTIERGAVRVSDRPGLGIELDRVALERLHRQYVECGIRERDDVGEMRKYDPGWAGTLPRF